MVLIGVIAQLVGQKVIRAATTHGLEEAATSNKKLREETRRLLLVGLLLTNVSCSAQMSIGATGVEAIS